MDLRLSLRESAEKKGINMLLKRMFAVVALVCWSVSGLAWEAEILSDETYQDVRRTVVVRLSEPVGNDVLDNIAFRLWGQQSHVARTYVEYYLPGMEPGAGAWAVAVYDRNEDPRMQITVYGFTAETQ